MPTATWDFEEEYLPGQPETYNEADLSYDEDKVDGINVLYNTIGEATSWSIEAK